jgi:POT family proton-dependent oligopeptide transporter
VHVTASVAQGPVEAGQPRIQGTFLGHPKGLFLLFFTEMWERFSYYGMRSLLVLYMVNHLFIQPDVGQRVLGFTVLKGWLESVFGPLAVQPLSSQIYGLYTGFVYFTPFFGGLLADRVLGQRRTVILGAVLMAIGHFMMASERMFFPALLFLIAGNGCFKPNISTQVGLLYPEGDSRRDGAFTIFYMGINLGAFFSPLVCGTLGQTVGWHWGFGAAGVGMVTGLIIYLWGQRYLAPDVLTQRRAQAAQPKQKMTSNEWARVGVLMVMCFLVSVFWAVFEQQGNTMQLWADKNTNWSFAGLHIPSTWYQAFNPFMIFAFAPLLNIFWAKQAKSGGEPASLTKMGFGCLFLGLSYVVMIVASHGMAPDAQRSVLWLVGTTVILTLGELYLSPIGLSFVTKVAPARMVSMLMGVWFLANFAGNYLSGYIGSFYEKMPRETFFWLLLAMGVGAGLIMFVISRPLDRAVAAHDRRAT